MNNVMIVQFLELFVIQFRELVINPLMVELNIGINIERLKTKINQKSIKEINKNIENTIAIFVLLHKYSFIQKILIISNK